MQVVDLIDALALPRNRAKNPAQRRIKQLAQLWAGSAQSYPQAQWKAAKVSTNQELGGAPSDSMELRELTACHRSGFHA
ncbi:MAG: hypothetical protein AB7F38_06785 [Piscinibacter sp.]